MRGVGQTSGGFAIECAMDEIAHELGIDPIEMRLRNYADVDPRQWRQMVEQIAARVLHRSEREDRMERT